MSEPKSHQFRPPLYADRGNGLDRDTSSRRIGDAGRERQGWDAYRKWLTNVGRQSAARSAVDQSLYSWKGYNSWAERIRQTWKTDEP